MYSLLFGFLYVYHIQSMLLYIKLIHPFLLFFVVVKHMEHEVYPYSTFVSMQCSIVNHVHIIIVATPSP